MTSELLRKAASIKRTSRTVEQCSCQPPPDAWFDRSICPEPCDSMHYVCVECGRKLERCAWDEVCAQPSAEDLALADWLDEVAERAVRVEEWGVNVGQVDWSQHPLTLARLIVGEQP